MNEQKTKTSWFAGDFAYQFLYDLKRAQIQCLILGDVPRMFELFRKEFAIVWERVKHLSVKADKPREHWDKQMELLTELLYDPRIFNDNPDAEKRESINYTRAKIILSELDFQLTCFEAEANLLIPYEFKKDPNQAMMQYGG